MSSSVQRATRQELAFLTQPTLVTTLFFGGVGYLLSKNFLIKPGIGFVWGLSGSIVATIVAPIFTYLATGIADGPFPPYLAGANATFLSLSGYFISDVLVGIGTESIGIMPLIAAMEVLILAYLAKMVARIAFAVFQDCCCG